ncbi:hypothetical protein HPP92_002710 [Vanilla planifolia]|uniref:Uncharacterized protein n=1 Tax=Vanilla planifolia TaxID=51239 RepID=A0A835RTV5_VANPL|nr:hypothetical protein HPP92_002710 [Vanilla planifolia]
MEKVEEEGRGVREEEELEEGGGGGGIGGGIGEKIEGEITGIGGGGGAIRGVKTGIGGVGGGIVVGRRRIEGEIRGGIAG